MKTFQITGEIFKKYFTQLYTQFLHKVILLNVIVLQEK